MAQEGLTLAQVKASEAFIDLPAERQARFDQVARAEDAPDIEWLDGEEGVSRRDLRLYVESREMALDNGPKLHLAEPDSVAPARIAGVERRVFQEAVAKAQASLFGYLAGRSRTFKGVVYGPTLDGTYFYRLGDRGTHGWGMRREELEDAQTVLVGQGFPTLQLEELRLVNYTSYMARRTGSENNGKETYYAVKHFPGGDERVELTEREEVSYDDPESIRAWLTMFADVIESDDPPAWVMLSHARYAREPFVPSGWAPWTRAAAEQRLETNWLLEGIEFEQIPASLNPAIVRYLREDLDFEGSIIGDWYNMDAVKKFVNPIAEKLGLQSNLVIIMMALYAGVDSIPAADATNLALEQLQEKYPERYAELEELVDRRLVESFRRLGGDRNLEIDLSSMTLYHKLHLRCDGEIYAGAVDAEQEDDQAVVELLTAKQNYDVGSGDIWNRTGVMTMVLRQKIVENLTGRTYATPPRRRADEERWFDELTKDTEFRQVYDAIQWDSPQIHQVYRTLSRRVIRNGRRPLA